MKKMVNGQLVDMTPEEIAARNEDISNSEADYAANGYKDRRSYAYPSIADQLDKIFHHGIEAWKTDIQAIKDDNPKPL
jgi:hypothetical protein